jgi:hypothetical protein
LSFPGSFPDICGFAVLNAVRMKRLTVTIHPSAESILNFRA